jgi:hypothetical protein
MTTTAPDCVALGGIAASPAPPLSITDLGSGQQRVTSAEGGYSIDVPSGWLVKAGVFSTPSFAQAHMTSYDPNLFYRQGQAVPVMPPPDLGIRLDIEVWANTNREAPDKFAANVVHNSPDGLALLPGRFVDIAGRQAYHAAIQDERRVQASSGALQVTRQTRLVWIIPTVDMDRYLVIVATPGESSLAGVVENAVSNIRLIPRLQSRMPVIHQRTEIINRWLLDKSGPIPGRRVEAKLTTYAAASAVISSGHGGLLRLDRDPEELFWLVAMTGGPMEFPFGPMVHPGGSPQPTPRPFAWTLTEAPATNDDGVMTTGAASADGNWPPGFDALSDLCQ